jgi:hypothetical protein
LLRYFRINDPYRLLGLLGLLFIIYLPLFIDSPDMTKPELKSLVIGERIADGYAPYTGLIDSVGPITAYFYGLMNLIFGGSLLARHILAFFILFSQSLYLGVMFINRKTFSENTLIPSFLFSVLAFFSFDDLALTGELIGSGFLLLAINSLFKEIEFRTQKSETVFNLGLCISLATLCSFSFIIHLLSACAILVFYTRSSVRGFLLLIFGFLLPQLIVMSLYYLNDALPQLWEFYYKGNINGIADKLVSNTSMLYLGAIPLFYLVVSVVMLNREARFTKYQSQLLQSMFFWLIFSFFQAFHSGEFRPQSFIIIIPCLCFFLTHFLLMIRRRKFAEMNAWILLIGTVLVSYMARYNKLDSINYSLLISPKAESSTLKGKKILVLDNDLSLYRNNTLATPFLNWNLSKEILQQPDYYDNVIFVYESFKNDPPQVILDKNNVMPEFFNRIPGLKNLYRLETPGTYVLSNVNRPDSYRDR